ncbi:cyclophane-forming radical SAM peptide maturase AmcB [Streptomyces millisiae]|uniref:Cyclophane-forming radical SAM peptide maturase AmcB n=1 Tax=Streptomyces millisiae TaxID=3075542 RepID=A0ABU2LR58_9ACTN|nr:cyclophane-forming radical SAM peptide maturase AmcB [Streptomyces sp. DSM 44918]MDT0320072.1 cyclophane-forming radical SAM peptide maturase AmcB [Streptomyces sp. DSM 44918]
MRTRITGWRARYDQWFTAPQTVVVQPTTWCNLDCRYCYLPFRKLKHQMRPEVAAAVATSVAQLTSDGSRPIGIVWHGGEPLAVGPQKFTSLLAPFEELRHGGRVHHYVQTNATLISDPWCELLAGHDIRVGVSIDGPASMNTDRIDLHGKLAFDRTLRGIRRLREHGIAFSVISVVATSTVGRPEELLEFLAELGCHSVGFNIEEIEGANTDRQAPTPEQAEEFWRRTLTWTSSHGDRMQVRELERLAEYLHLIRTGQRAAWDERRLDPIPTVSVAGDVVLLSPELADTLDPAYDDFCVGNILAQPLAEILGGAHRVRYVRDFLTGLDRCRAECAFYDFCRGAQAANRYFENGSLRSTETNHCRVTRQALVHALSTLATKEKAT